MVKKKERTRLVRTDPNFYKVINDIINRKKIKSEQIKPTRTSRITLAMTRHKFFPLMVNDIIDADLKEK